MTIFELLLVIEVVTLKKVWPGALEMGAVLSALVAFTIFIVAKNNLFVALDDYAYIVNNPNIRTLGWKTVVWSFSSFYEGNWHPLTMLSLALDFHYWGLNPFGFHLTNIIIHCCSVFCSVFLFSNLFKAYTCRTETESVSIGSVEFQPINKSHIRFESSSVLSVHNNCILSGRAVIIGSISAALFFGTHPLRVESVVWASERKDVLCMLFIILALWMYIHTAVKRNDIISVSLWHYSGVYYALAFTALALLSKPTAVSLPLIFCLIDWCPLRQITDMKTLFRSLIEKIPFFALSAIGAVSTMFAQQIAMKHAPVVGLVSRLLVACKGLLFYISATVCPSGLTAFYMHPGDVIDYALPEYLFYLALVLVISLAAVLVRRHYKLFTALWLFYVVTILPMLGIIQVGGQWVADRYSYLPSLGIALLWGGGVAFLIDRTHKHQSSAAARFCLVLAACQLVFYSVQTVRQIYVWRDTETLATKIIDNTPHLSGAPYLARAIYRNEKGRHQMALEDVGEAMKIALKRGLTKHYPETAFVQAVILKNLGRFSEALTIMDWGIDTCVGPPPPDALTLRSELVSLAAGKK